MFFSAVPGIGRSLISSVRQDRAYGNTKRMCARVVGGRISPEEAGRLALRSPGPPDDARDVPSIATRRRQTVFGEGPQDAAVIFIGEQPGDQEDQAGHPFVGPSGQLLNEVLEKVGIPRDQVYVTNAVKHFKFEPRGARRIHSKPNVREIAACRPWPEAEIHAIKPQMIVSLGARRPSRCSVQNSD